MKKKQLALSVMSTALVASMAASAFAAAPKAGVYIGGNVDKYYSFTAMLDNMDTFLDEMIDTVPDVLYVDKDGEAKGGNLAELLFVSNPKSHFVDVTDEMFADIDGADGFNAVNADGTVEAVKRNPDGTEVVVTPGELKVEAVSANNLTKVIIKFNKAVDAVSSENFTIPGLTVESAQLSEDKKTVTLSVAGAEVSKDYKVTITKVKIDAVVQPDVTADFKTPSQNDLFKPDLQAKDTVLKSDNASQTLVTFTLKDAAGEVMKDAQDVEVSFASTWGSFAEKRVTVQNGVATVLFASETLSSDKVADITATVIEAKDKNLIGLKAITSILLTPNPDAVDPTTGALMGEASAYQADRVVAYFNKPVKVEDFVFASGDNKGEIDSKKAEVKVYTKAKNDGTGGDEVRVLGLLPVQGNEKALQLVLAKNSANFPLVDNANVRVVFSDKRGSVPVTSDKSFKLTDARVPGMLSVEREGLNKLKVVFSEAVMDINDTNAEEFFNSAVNLENWSIDGKSLKGGAWGVTPEIEVGEFNRKDGTDTRHVVTIKLGKDKDGNQIYFKPGTHSLQGANIGDWAAVSDPRDNVMNTQTLDFNIPVDNGAPGAVVDVQSPEQYLVTFDKELNQDANALAQELKLQVYNTDTSAWEAVTNPAIKVTNIGDAGSHYKFLVQTTTDWTVVHNTKDTNKNYYNYSYRLHIDAEKVVAASNGMKNAEINLTLGGAMKSPDMTSPTINQIEKTLGTEEGTSYDVTMSEPVKIGNGNNEGETPSQNQGAITGNETGLIPVPTAEFVKKDNSITIPANIGNEFVDKENKVIRVTPQKELEAGEWTLVVRSISDDVGNTAASARKDFTVVKDVKNTDFHVVWSVADYDGILGNDSSLNDPAYDYVFVKFSKEGATTGDHKNILKTANYKLNGKPLPTGTQIFADIKDYDDKDAIVDSITIRLPQGSITKPETTVIIISEYLESASGEAISNAGIMKLPFNYGVEAGTEVSDLKALKAALADDSIRTITLTGDITGEVSIERLVDIKLNGNNIIGNVSVNTKEGGKTTVDGGTIQGNLTVNTPNADFIVGNNVTVTGTTTIKDVASSTFVNNGTLGKVTIEDANGTGFVNNGTVGIVTVASNGSVTLGGTISDVVVTKGAKLSIEGNITNLTADKAAVTIVDGVTKATNRIVVNEGSFKDKDGNVIAPTQPNVPVVNSVELTNGAADAELTVGSANDATLTLTAVAKDADGNEIAGKTATFSSSDDTVATVNANGVVTAVAAGTATIKATIDGKEATFVVTVKAATPEEPVVATVGLTNSAADAELTLGSADDTTLTLTAVAKDADGNEIAGKTATFSSSDDTVATVDANGVVTAVAEGTATIKATIDGKEATFVVTVIS